ncbi:hypothetical protein [Burkholderia cepacia]|uniref:hypothetical protein n=1 Tax=Burkholderia cepacia TaxID=292 RepID=UPI002AB65674|nr:hypothetical protein [Burkholderia cepacia]
MTAHSFVDLGHGLYLAEDGAGEQYVADSTSADPDHLYGPAAWGGRAGPQSGRTLIRLKYVGRDDYLSALDEHVYADGPNPGDCPLWPASIEITEAGAKAGLLLGVTTCANVMDLTTAIDQHIGLRQDARLAVASQHDRLATAEHIHTELNRFRRGIR